MNYKELRIKYPKFYYRNFNWEVVGDDLNIIFKFVVGDHTFEPKLTYKNVDIKRINSIKDSIDTLVFNIGMVEVLSYWKAFASPEIIVECGNLDEYQIGWWHDLLMNGMSQYFYENGIDFTDNSFVKYISLDTSSILSPIEITSDQILIPVGGGKDSSTTAEILSSNLSNISAFLLNPSKAAFETSKSAGIPNIIVERSIDNKIIELNKSGYLNGHTPFTALLSFASILAAVIGNFGVVVFSNERSSDEDNTKYLGKSINHQYSKTFDFENKFRDYNLRYLSNVNYFSFLRPLYDIQIAKIFSKFDKYFMIIRSCNIGQNTDTWCGKCPKCLSTFVLLYPFAKERTIKIFDRNLLEDKSLGQTLNALTDDNEVKPFECVGTRHELRVALNIEKDDTILNSWSVDNNLPDQFQKLLKKYV